MNHGEFSNFSTLYLQGYNICKGFPLWIDATHNFKLTKKSKHGL